MRSLILLPMDGSFLNSFILSAIFMGSVSVSIPFRLSVICSLMQGISGANMGAQRALASISVTGYPSNREVSAKRSQALRYG